ncbi:hypothetical protein ACFX15_000572 [Malus domestica]
MNTGDLITAAIAIDTEEITIQGQLRMQKRLRRFREIQRPWLQLKLKKMRGCNRRAKITDLGLGAEAGHKNEGSHRVLEKNSTWF